MKLLNSVVFAVAVVFIEVASGAPSTDAEVQAELQRLARGISATLPSGSQQFMLLAVTAGPGRRFTYRSAQAISASEWTAAMKAHSLRIARNDYCTNPGMQAFRHYGVTVTWQISDLEGRHVTSNVVSPPDCR